MFFGMEVFTKSKKGRLNKIENNITELLEDKRFIKASNSNFTLYELNQKKSNS